MGTPFALTAIPQQNQGVVLVRTPTFRASSVRCAPPDPGDCHALPGVPCDRVLTPCLGRRQRAPPLRRDRHMSLDANEVFAAGFLRNLHDAVNAHDATAIGALCHQAVVWEDPAAPGTLHGRDAVVGFHRDIMFPALPDVRVEIIEGPFLSAAGTEIAVRLRVSGRMEGYLTPPGFAPTKRKLSFETAEFSHLSEGLLIRHTVVLNMLDLARQIGAAPRAGTVAARIGVLMQHVSALWARTFGE